MTYNFYKMHGLGNDFAIVDFKDKQITDISFSEHIVRHLACRNKGIGFDQLLILAQGIAERKEILIYNSDGSKALSCGNAYRGLIYYLSSISKSNGQVSFYSNSREIKGQVLNYDFNLLGNYLVKVDLGNAEVKVDKELDQKYKICCEDNSVLVKNIMPLLVDIGNRHLVVFVENLDSDDILGYGTIFSEYFNGGLNVSFVEVISPSEINIKILERGAGWTLSCGSGACSSVKASLYNGLCKGIVKVNMPGGSLNINASENGDMFITGEVSLSYKGSIELKSFGFNEQQFDELKLVRRV